VDTFLLESAEKLAKRPQSVEDIAIAQRNWHRIEILREAVQSKRLGVRDFGSVLNSYATGDGADIADLSVKMNSLNSRWATLEDQMEAFNEMVEIQKESLKVRLDEHVIEHNQLIAKFSERWCALRPRDPNSWDIKSVNQTFDQLDERVSRVMCFICHWP